MSFDEIFDLTAGVYFNFYNISHSWSVFSFFIIYILVYRSYEVRYINSAVRVYDASHILYVVQQYEVYS